MQTPEPHTFAARKQRWRQFLANDRPPRHLFTIHYPPDDLPRPPLAPEFKAQRVEWSWAKYERQMRRAEWLHDDSLPHLDMLTGTEIFAEALGCPVNRPADNMPHALPLIHSAAEVGRVRVPELSRSPLAYQFEMADELRRRAGPDALLRLVDIQSPMDIAALLWDKNDFYAALLETPEAVCEVAAKAHELLTAFMDEWFRRYGREFISHYPLYYMDGGLTLSEDEVGGVSTQTFEDLFLPELTRLSEHYGGLGMHCCANARHQWDGFLRIPNLKALNLVHKRETILEAQRFFAAHTVQMHCWAGDGEPWTWPERFPAGSRIVIELSADTIQKAIELATKMSAACAR